VFNPVLASGIKADNTRVACERSEVDRLSTATGQSTSDAGGIYGISALLPGTYLPPSWLTMSVQK
jgi:hypothetical protein